MAFRRSRVRLPSGPPTPALRSVVAGPSGRRSDRRRLRLASIGATPVRSTILRSRDPNAETPPQPLAKSATISARSIRNSSEIDPDFKHEFENAAGRSAGVRILRVHLLIALRDAGPVLVDGASHIKAGLRRCLGVGVWRCRQRVDAQRFRRTGPIVERDVFSDPVAGDVGPYPVHVQQTMGGAVGKPGAGV